jgi:hypothetical protein
VLLAGTLALAFVAVACAITLIHGPPWRLLLSLVGGGAAAELARGYISGRVGVTTPQRFWVLTLLSGCVLAGAITFPLFLEVGIQSTSVAAALFLTFVLIYALVRMAVRSDKRKQRGYGT